MNDYGLFKAIVDALGKNEAIARTVTGIFTHCPPDSNPPYLLYEILDIQTDAPAAIQRAAMSVRISVVSTYKGIKEISALINILRQVLENQVLLLAFGGEARLRLQKHEIALNKDKVTREGYCLYKVWIRLKEE